MILTSNEIIKQIADGVIAISDFDEARLGPNSYNVRLHKDIVTYSMPYEHYLDAKKDNPTAVSEIPEDGMILHPNRLYLGRTVETTLTNYPYVPMIEGRSSIGRLGLQVHITAGFGDIGFNGCWTLEMSVIHPVKIYPNMEIAQIYYHKVIGNKGKTYSGKYQNATTIQSSEIFREYTEI